MGELDILRGASKLLQYGAVNAIAFELATSFLRYQGHEPIALFFLLYQHGFDIYKMNSNLNPLQPAELRRYACPLPYYVADFLAVFNKTRAQEPVSERDFVCR